MLRAGNVIECGLVLTRSWVNIACIHVKQDGRCESTFGAWVYNHREINYGVMVLANGINAIRILYKFSKASIVRRMVYTDTQRVGFPSVYFLSFLGKKAGWSLKLNDVTSLEWGWIWVSSYANLSENSLYSRDKIRSVLQHMWCLWLVKYGSDMLPPSQQ